MHRFGWMGLGALGGVVLAGGFAVYIINILIPWEAICATVAPSQELVRIGGSLIMELEAWLASAQAFLAAGEPEAQAQEVRQGLGGALDRAQSQLQAGASVVVNATIEPLRLLIEAAQLVLREIRAVVEAAQTSLDSIDQARC